ncbi:putative OPA3-like protein CG13603 [Musca vetustissima]|uniref:putative OPA3-like protein CG13603 n=1 Tax=Musca vetustissima TaxID=27455 RepID=UPI002AB77824|nr:putative OPA3-like protein CG13603 [Musca vetustissima]
MVIGAFPAAKLGVLAIKQVSKPIANIIKSKAKEHPLFRNYICMPPAQLYNWVEVKTKMWALNLGKPVNVPPLTEAMAVELGANLLGEFIIFAIGAGLLIFEYARQTSNEAKKQEKMALEKAELTNNLAELTFRLERQDAQLRELTRVLADIESRSIFRWTRERLSEYQPFNPDNPDQSLNKKPQTKSPYHADGGLVMRALHFLDTQVFTNSPVSVSQQQQPQHQTSPPPSSSTQNVMDVPESMLSEAPAKSATLLKMNTSSGQQIQSQIPTSKKEDNASTQTSNSTTITPPPPPLSLPDKSTKAEAPVKAA